MSPRTSIRRWVTHGGLTVAAALTLAAGALAAVTGAQAAATRAAPVSNPYSPAYHHSYRHGVIPTIAVEAKMSVFPDAGPRHPSHSAGGVHSRVSRGLSVLIIGGLSALSWGVLVGIVMALRAAL